MRSFSKNIWRAMVVAVGVLAICAVSEPAAAQTAIDLAVGGRKTISLQENPSTGYRWQLSPSESTNLSIVRVSDGGFSRGGSGLIGAPGIRRWIITGVQPGTASVVFIDVRPWAHDVARRHTLTVNVRARLTRTATH